MRQYCFKIIPRELYSAIIELIKIYWHKIIFFLFNFHQVGVKVVSWDVLNES